MLVLQPIVLDCLDKYALTCDPFDRRSSTSCVADYLMNPVANTRLDGTVVNTCRCALNEGFKFSTQECTLLDGELDSVFCYDKLATFCTNGNEG
jgi:hypothetical protein